MANFSNPNFIDPSLVRFLDNTKTLTKDDSDLTAIKTKLSDVILPGISPDDYPNIPILGENESMEIKMNDYSQIYTTGEDRARVAKFTDPLNLNFKVFIDFDRKGGLVADESNVDSALAYLKRIGEIERYERLQVWIQNIKTLFSDYDFLFEEIEGLDIIQNQKPGQFFVYSPETVKIQFRETLDMYIQSLIVTYHHICFDKIRGVSVLPSNLRKVDLYVLVYAAGYFNMLFHDVVSDETLDHLVLPTKRKLSQDVLSLDNLGEFNYTLYEIKSCEIDASSGSQFLSSISNEMSGDMVKNNLTFKYKFADFSGAYNNLMGGENFYSILALTAAANKVANQHKVTQFTSVLTNSPNDQSSIWQKLKDSTTLDDTLLNSFNQFSQASTYTKMFQNIKGDTLARLNKIAFEDLPNKLLGPNSVITRTLEKFTPQYASLLVQNTIDRGISTGVNQYIDTPITKVNNLLLTGFSDDLVDIYKNMFPKKVDGLQVIEQTPRYSPQNNTYNYSIDDTYGKPNMLKEIDNENVYEGTEPLTNPDIITNQSGPKYSNPIKVVNENIYDKNSTSGNGGKGVVKNIYVRRGF